MKVRSVTLAALVCTVFLTGPATSAGAWTKRMGNLQNTGNVGVDPALTPETVRDLELLAYVTTDGTVNATPVVSDGLLFVGDGGNGRYFYVVDLENDYRRLVRLDTGATVSTPLIGNGMQSTAALATVTVPVLDGEGNPTGETVEQRRVYFGANVKPKSFWCLDVDAILAARETLDEDDGSQFLCDGADWPIIVAGLGTLEGNAATELTQPLPVYNGSPVFSKNQRIRVGRRGANLLGPLDPGYDGRLENRDVIFTPTIGADCSDGQLWAIDAYTAEVLWVYDPVPNFQSVVGNPVTAGPGHGGVIWTVPAMSADRKHLYVTTGDCVEQPQVGFQAESLVALDPVEGTVQWYHQRRLIDTSDYDIGNSPTVVDVEGDNGCHVVVSTDKDGCIYAFRQQGDMPQVGSPGYDPTRHGQQRILWRQCFVPGSLNGGFNASGASAHGRVAFAQANPLMDMQDDNITGVAVDACTGDVLWTTNSIGNGRTEAAVASGMIFQGSGRRVQVFRAEGDDEVLATLELPAGMSSGGGGPAIADGRLYVPVSGGVAIFAVNPGSNVSPPEPSSTPKVFGGPYPFPIGTGPGPVMMPVDPYDPYSPPAGPVEEWPSMNPELE